MLLAKQALPGHGYTVVDTPDAVAAIDIARQVATLDPLVTDMVLGEMTAREMLETVRAGRSARAAGRDRISCRRPSRLHALVRKVLDATGR